MRASGCGARIDAAQLPVSRALLECAGPDAARDFALTGGDDYELCFAVPAARLPLLGERAPAARWPHREIGVLDATGRIEFRAGESLLAPSRPGYDHFAR